MAQRDRLYWIWSSMLGRCRNPRDPGFKNYGGRGISVCARWLKFKNFADDMGPRPDGMTLDRINNDGNYEPGNCRWTTRQKQNSNRRNCILVNDGDERITLKEFCRRHGLRYRPIVKRIKDRGWPLEIALTAPLGTRLESLNG